MVVRIKVSPRDREKLNVVASKFKGLGKEASRLTFDLAERVRRKALLNFESIPHPYSENNSINRMRVNQLSPNQYEVRVQGGASIAERGRRPINGKLMVFRLPDGRFVRTTSVRGVEPQNFLRDAVDEEVRLFGDRANVELEEYFKR